jgi:hypothetical protein
LDWPYVDLFTSGSSGPSFLDGISRGSLPYRLYRNPTATWVYIEKFTSQEDAEDFCRSAGGPLAVPSTPQEQREVATLLNGTLAYLVKYNHVTDADFNLWIGLKRPNQGSGGWTTTTGAAVPQPSAWAADHPQRVDNQTCAGPCSCAVLGWYWSGNFSWWSYGCGWSDMALAALCRLPPVGKNEEAAVPKGA